MASYSAVLNPAPAQRRVARGVSNGTATVEHPDQFPTYQAPSNVSSPSGPTKADAGPFAMGAPSSDYYATPMRVDYGAIPQVTSAPVTAQVSAPGQNWAPRYAQDYGASLGALNAASQQRQHMQAVAAGQAGPSLAELQLRQGQETAAANAMGAALTGRGGPGVQIAAMRAGGAASMQANQQAAQQRAAEQLAAEQQVGTLLGQEQAGAAGLGGLTASQAGLEQGWQGQAITAQQANQEAALANAAAAQAAQQANQEAYLAAMGTEAGTYEASLAANTGIAQSNLEQAGAADRWGKDALKGAVSGLGGAMMMMSDERSKQRVEELNAENATLRGALEAAATGRGPEVDAMRAARPSAYEYTPDAYSGEYPGAPRSPRPAAAPGERMVGVMAQDVARGGDPGLVQRDPYSGSLGVDTGKLASAAAAGSSAALTRQDDLEARLARLEQERQMKDAFLAQEQAAFDDRYNAYLNAEQWSGQTPTPTQRPAPWLEQYMGG